jgi:hypothetical protein
MATSRICLTFTDYDASDIGATVEFSDVVKVERMKRSNTMIVTSATSTARHSFRLDRIADIRLTVHEGSKGGGV